MAEDLPTLLVIEDDIDITEMLAAFFKGQGYMVYISNWGEDGIQLCLEKLPDLVILDIRLPDIDGFEVARRLRTSRRTELIPIIFLTAKRERTSRLKGLGLRADDYITKPFDMQELRLKVKNILQRSQRSSINNPITGLPEGSLVDERLAVCLKQSQNAGLLVCLNNMETFREVYGFVASDDLVRAITSMLAKELNSLVESESFLGHITGTDLLLIIPEERVGDLKERIQQWASHSLLFFYRDQDLQSGSFTGKELKLRLYDVKLSGSAFTSAGELRAHLMGLSQGNL